MSYDNFPMYKEELAQLQSSIQTEKNSFFNMFREVERADEETLRHMGQKSKLEAYEHYFKHFSAKINKLEKDFVRKWPD